MEQVWDKKKLARLMEADPETIDNFFESYADLIFTWLYYQVGADPEIALDLTDRALRESIRNLNQFDPARESFTQWIRQQAKHARDEGLQTRQIQPQRPWAWSQIPQNILKAISKLRSENLDDDVVRNTYVREIVQASLVEMEQSDSLLMVQRYNHLHVPEHIAEEFDMDVEQVNDRLYRCRHSFRRVFFQLIALSNPGFSESSAAGTMEMLDGNLETLLSSVTVYQKISEKQRVILRDNLIQAAHQSSVSQSKPAGHLKPIVLTVSVLTVLLIVLLGIFLVTRSGSDQQTPLEPEKPNVAEKEKESEEKAVTQKPDEIDEEELKRVLLLGQMGDINGLLAILKDGQFTSQYTAAHFIGQLGDESAIGLLEEAEQKWYPNGPDDNPFSLAIVAIEDRLYPETEVVEQEVMEPEEKEEPVEAKNIEEAEEPTFTGRVTDYSGNPVSGAKIEVHYHPMFGKQTSPDPIAGAVTNAEGVYQVTHPLNDAIWAYCRQPENKLIFSRQALWFQDNIARINNFGGQPALTGTISQFGQPMAGQSIILSDNINPGHAAFYAQTETDNQGNYSFLGVHPGLYYILDGKDGNTRYSSVQVTNEQSMNYDIQLDPVEVVLDADVPEDGLQIKRSLLMYTMDMTPLAFRIAAVQDSDGAFIFHDVIPGSYYLMTMLDNDIWMQQEVEILPAPEQQTVMLDPIPVGQVYLSGQLINPSPVDLFLTNTNQQLRIPLVPDAGNAYQVELIPADAYKLITRIHGTTVELMEVDLQQEAEVLDMDPLELINSFSPLYAVVIDQAGKFVDGAQVWITGGIQTLTTESTGRGAFLAAPAGEYTLYAVQPGQPAVEQPVVIRESSLLAPPDSENTVVIQLKGF